MGVIEGLRLVPTRDTRKKKKNNNHRKEKKRDKKNKQPQKKKVRHETKQDVVAAALHCDLLFSSAGFLHVRRPYGSHSVLSLPRLLVATLLRFFNFCMLACRLASRLSLAASSNTSPWVPEALRERDGCEEEDRELDRAWFSSPSSNTCAFLAMSAGEAFMSSVAPGYSMMTSRLCHKGSNSLTLQATKREAIHFISRSPAVIASQSLGATVPSQMKNKLLPLVQIDKDEGAGGASVEIELNLEWIIQAWCVVEETAKKEISHLTKFFFKFL